ncbi:carbohydrate ABC transporter permease [Jiangella alkaliphila]|uniref:Carbohydrate ABC transporter membrane protein 1, CUT1 family n=1 Tax=Jiangella alkaliphila TaxID=419479 RepID=A0A1H2LA95_9ACTN|nr:sugar ABC transporter permease [Jiangella alkaliphila]SDU77528.1 carbohydrate ABC transporter membrane protein 1, CUT1 family [Jiangella alkaliphila]
MTRVGRGGSLSGWAFLAPYAVAVVLLIAVPALLNVGYAFTDHTGLTRDPQFTGLDNVRRLAEDGFLADSLEASLFHVALSVPLRLIAAVGLGLLLAAPRPGGRWFRTAVYLPTVVPDVALAVLFLWVLNPLYGPLNQLLGLFGHPGYTWLSDPATARIGVVLMLLFPIGEGFVVVLAARRLLDGRLYEAAALEGCGPFGQLRRITLPLLAPVLVLLAVRDTIMTLQVNFVPAYVLTDGRPANATLYLPVYIFDHAFEFSGFAYAALITIVLMLITAAIITVQLLAVRRWRVLR